MELTINIDIVNNRLGLECKENGSDQIMQQGVASNQMLAKTFVTDSCLIVIQRKHLLNIAKYQLAIKNTSEAKKPKQ